MPVDAPCGAAARAERGAGIVCAHLLDPVIGDALGDRDVPLLNAPADADL